MGADYWSSGKESDFMNYLLIVLAFFLVCLFYVKHASGNYNSIKPIIVYYEERVPYVIKTADGSLSGLVGKPAIFAFKNSLIPYELKPLPVKRQISYLKRNHGRLCLMGWYKNKERESFAQYSHFVYQDKIRVGIGREDNSLLTSGGTVGHTLSKPFIRVLVKGGYSYGSFLDTQFAKYKPTLEVTTSDSIKMLKMIHAGRADIFFLAQEEADALIPETGLPKADFSYIVFTDMPPGHKRYLLFSRQVERETIQLLNKQLIRYHNKFSN